jgi:peptide chain release factor 2
MERDHLSKQLDAIEKIEYQLNDSIELIKMAEEVGDDETVEEIAKEIQNLAKEASQSEIECMLSDEMDSSSCFLEIHSGAGGTESDDWASMLLRMYLRWAEKHRYKISIVDQLDGEEAGVKSATVKLEGMNAFGWLKVESGIHRLVRISPFNSAGKRHTSFASVNVIPVINDDVEINIVESDLRIDTYRSSGAGGQHVNTTDSAVRITHIPTGIVAQCQNNRSQHKNRDECMSMLKSKLYELEMQKRREKANEENEKKSDIGWGHQIRSYVLHPYKMVKDLRTGFKVTDTGAVLDGEIDDFIRSMLELKLSGKGFTLITEDD